MPGFMADCLVRATLLGAGVHGVLLLLRIRSPRIRHLLWSAATVTMLMLPVLRALDAGLKLGIPVPAPTDGPHPLAGSSVLFGGAKLERYTAVAYALGSLFLLGRLLWGTWRARRLVGSAFAEAGVLVSPVCASPVTVGWWRPRIVLPTSFRSWPSEQLRAVLTHEREHARWRDPLAQWLGLLNRSVFWVHPMAWWMERRLSDLAEDACDCTVLSQGHSPVAYSGFLLDCAAARKEREFGSRIAGRGLARRIPRILSGGRRSPDPRWRVALAAVLCGVVAFGTAALSVHVVSVHADAFAPARTGADPLPIVVLTPTPASLTAVAAPVEQGSGESVNLRAPGPPQSERARRLTGIYLDLAGMSVTDRTRAGDAARRWLAGLPVDHDREIAIVVNAGGRTKVAQSFTLDRNLIADKLDSLLMDRSPVPPASVQARINAVESVVQELLALPGERDLVCLLGTDAAVTADPGLPSRPGSVRFIPSSLLLKP